MPPVDLQTLHAKIGQLALENDFISGALGKAGLLRQKKKRSIVPTLLYFLGYPFGTVANMRLFATRKRRALGRN